MIFFGGLEYLGLKFDYHEVKKSNFIFFENSSIFSLSITKPGNYSLSVTNPNVSGCSVNDNFTVTSKLPLTPDTVEYCDGGGATVALVGKDGKKYAWSTQQSMSPLIGSGTSVNWNIPNGTSGNQTLWFQSAETSPLGSGGPNIGTTSSALSTLNTEISANEPVLLKTASIGVEAWTGGCSGAGSGNVPVTVSVIGSGITVDGILLLVIFSNAFNLLALSCEATTCFRTFTT